MDEVSNSEVVYINGDASVLASNWQSWSLIAGSNLALSSVGSLDELIRWALRRRGIVTEICKDGRRQMFGMLLAFLCINHFGF